MKGKDEESGLEKRQNREVGQRQATSVFCVRRHVPVHSCSKRWGRWMTAVLLMTPRARQKHAFIPRVFLSCIYCRQCNHRYFICHRDNFIKSDACQRICLDASANCRVNGGLDFCIVSQVFIGFQVSGLASWD